MNLTAAKIIFKIGLLSQILLPCIGYAQGVSAGGKIDFVRDSATSEARIQTILSKMTVEEKVAMCLGADGHAGPFSGVARLGIPKMGWADGPRGPHSFVKNEFTTAMPCGVAFGSTWDTGLLYNAGVEMGQETRAIGKGVLFGPGINILRDPLNGRFFEYYSEDPFLTGQLASVVIKGIQSQRVAACLKHYACNNRENNRNLYEAMVDERTLREIYLPAFHAGVDAGALTVMTAANGVNGDLCSDSRHLLKEILKDEWGFKGFVLTDWCGTRSTDKAAFAGLDVAMPYRENSLFKAPLLAAVKSGKIPEKLIDDKALRVLRVISFNGLLDNIAPTDGGVINTKEHQLLARKVAEESIVLLKNDQNVLPLNREKVKKIVVLGPNADQRFCLNGLGGSSWVESPYEITPFEGIKNIAGKDISVEYVSTDELSGFRPITSEDTKDKKGFTAKYYNDSEKEPALVRNESSINFAWEMRSPDMDKIKPDYFRAEFSAVIMPPVTGTYILKISADERAHLIGPSAAPLAVCDIGNGGKTTTATVHMEAGKPYPIKLYYNEDAGDAYCQLQWSVPQQNKSYESKLKELDKIIKKADAVVFVGGIDHSQDVEGRDRSDMEFPSMQEDLIRHVASVNHNTIVTLINGSPLTLSGWLNDVPGVIEAWYPGMEGGTAIGEVLFGDVNPSGRLPFSWPLKLSDVPMYALRTENKDRVDYLEGVFVGYRYYETWNVKPQFAFGYGLSYTDFKYNNLVLSESSMQQSDILTVSVNVINTGRRDGEETVQLYINDSLASVARPTRELKGFQKIKLAAGETKTVVFNIDKLALSFYDVGTKSWKAEPGTFEVQIGKSSDDIILTKKFELTK